MSDSGRQMGDCRHSRTPAYCVECLRTKIDYLEVEIARLKAENEDLKLVHTEARELVGEADATGVIPVANLNALRALLWRSSIKRNKGSDQ